MSLKPNVTQIAACFNGLMNQACIVIFCKVREECKYFKLKQAGTTNIIFHLFLFLFSSISTSTSSSLTLFTLKKLLLTPESSPIPIGKLSLSVSLIKHSTKKELNHLIVKRKLKYSVLSLVLAEKGHFMEITQKKISYGYEYIMKCSYSCCIID